MTAALQARCRVCGRGVIDGQWLARVNEKGVPGIWSCQKHLGRLPCEVPFCRRTIAQGDSPASAQWICGQHWREVPKAARVELARRRKRARRTQTRGAWLRFYRQWERCRDWAIERAVGLS